MRALDVGQCEDYATSLSRSRHGAMPQDHSLNSLYNLHDQSRYARVLLLQSSITRTITYFENFLCTLYSLLYRIQYVQVTAIQ